MGGNGGSATSINGEKSPFFSEAAVESALPALVNRYAKHLFGFCLSYGPFTREQAFRITVAAFAASLNRYDPAKGESVFLEALFRRALAECADTPPAGSEDLSAFGALPMAPQLALVRKALLGLSLEDRALLLLRDQIHLPFDNIAVVLGKAERLVRSECLTARERMREMVSSVLEKKEPPRAV